jgi:hypothetical protein
LLIKTLTALVALVVAQPSLAASAEQRTAFEATLSDFANPERGFYAAGEGNLEELGKPFFEGVYKKGFRLVYARIDLAAYRQSGLPAPFLMKLTDALEAARSSGMKLIVRTVYNYPAGETEYRSAQDAQLSVVLGHIRQLKPLLQANSDVIAFVQAGFIGAWGEWHTSSNKLTEPTARQEIRDALLDAVPRQRFVQFRYPPYLMAWTPRLPALAAALDGTFRTGFHNDCFLASSTDVGTYSEVSSAQASERDFADRLGDLAPFGGETCNPADAPGAQSRSSCSDIIREGARFNLTYLNAGYYRPLFHDRWLAQGCAAIVASKMGYRLRLLEAAHPTEAVPGASLAWHIKIANDGWARLYNPRKLQILLRDRSSGRVERIDSVGSDPRGWLPGQESDITARIILPKAILPGDYDVLLALPDNEPRLRDDPRFAIRFANADSLDRGQRWDMTLGAFATGTTIGITAS